MTTAAGRRATTGSQLRAVLDLIAPSLAGATTALWRPEGLVARYQRYLVTMHGVVRASVPLMETALRELEARGGGDVEARLCAYLAQHIVEERDHDAWLLDDLAAAGGDPRRASAVPPPTAARLVGPAYYWVHHVDPVCLLGYMAALEANAPSPTLAVALEQRTGLPSAAFRTLAHHAAADTGHADEIVDLLDALPLRRELGGAVRLAAFHTVRSLVDLVDELRCDRAHRKDTAP